MRKSWFDNIKDGRTNGYYKDGEWFVKPRLVNSQSVYRASPFDNVELMDTRTSGEIKCQQCGSQMSKTMKAEKSLGLQLLGVLLFLFGVGLLFVFPLGTLFGVVLMLGSLGLGYSKKKVWECVSCGYFFERT